MRPVAEAMEERILHSADIGPLLLGSEVNDSRAVGATETATQTKHNEIAFIDAALPDADELRADLLAQQAAGRPIEIVTLDRGSDGLALITQTLADRHGISAVHVLAHGSDGVLQLGTVSLDAQTLLQRAAEVAGWSSALTADADLLLYGCDVAQTESGQHFVQDLAALTDADVAASIDPTGAARLGGNWILEQTVGAIDARLAPSAAMQQQWRGTMALVGSDSFTTNGNIHGNGGGTGWSDNWSNNSSQFNVGGAGLSDPSGLLPASGGSVQLTISGNLQTASAVRNLSTTLGADGTSTWISFLVQPNRVGFADYAGVEFGSTSATVGFAGYDGSNFVLGVAGSTTPTTVSGINPVAGTTYLLVIQITHAAGNDAVTLYVNPTPGQATPNSTHTASTSLNLGTFTRIALSGGNGFGTNNARLDEISVGQSFADVAPSTNAAPVIATTGTALTYTENQVATAIDAGATVSDSDNTNLTGATVSISANYANGQDVLGFTNQLGISGNWNAGTGVLTLSGTATVANYQAALRTVTYANSSDNPSTAARTVSFAVDDGTSTSNVAAKAVTVAAVNDTPVITSNGGGASASLGVAENTNAVTTVTATDAEGSALLYSIVGGADAARFSIDGASGVLRFIVPPNFEAPTDAGANNVYDVTVRASDGALATSQTIAVTVTNTTEALSTTVEQRINTATAGTQETSLVDRGSPRAVAVSASGSHVVVWSSQNQDGSGWGVYGQRYDATGAKVGAEFAVNQVTTNDQPWATVAIDASGRFVVSWTSANQDGTPQSIYARTYAADGSASSSEFRVNTTATGVQHNGSVAMDANGNFVVVWQGNGPGDSDGIFGRRFDAAGTALDAVEFRVNTDLSRTQYDPVVSMNASGAFAVTWDNTIGVQVRLYDSSGAALGGEINVHNSLSSGNGSVALADDGSLVVVWRETVLLDQDVYFQRYSAAGAAIGGVVAVNATLLSNQTDPSIAMDGVGNFIVVWEGSGPGDSAGVFGQKYDAAGNAVGGEFLLNSATTGTQAKVSVALLDLDNFVAVWSGQGPGDTSGVFARQYGTLTVAPVITSNGGSNTATIAIAENTVAVTTVTATDADLPAQTLSYSIVGGDDAGRFAINASTGVLRFSVAPDFEAPNDLDANNVYSVIVQASDGALNDTQALAVSVTNVNDSAPVSAPASAAGSEDTLLAVTLNASDADSSVASFTVQALPADGTLYLDASRSTAVVAGTAYLASGGALTLYFSPAADWNGSAGFDFSATDDLGLAGALAHADLTVSAVNDAPSAANASATTGENTLLVASVPAASDIDGSIASYALVSGLGAGNGSLTFNADGSYVFNPGSDFDALAAGASRVVTFTYSAVDNLGTASALATATLTVNGSNDPALLGTDVINLTEGDSAATISTSGVLAISDVDGPAAFVAQSATAGSYGTFAIDAAGAWTYSAGSAHDEFVSGSLHTETFAVSSVDGTPTSVTVNISGSNDAPVASAASASTTENTVLAASVPAASDIDGTIVSYALVSGVGPGNGSLTFNADGTYVFDPGSDFDALFAGANRNITFAFTALDNLGLASAAATVTLSVGGSNDAPLLSTPMAGQSATEDTPINFSLPAGTFSDADAGDTLTCTARLASGAALPSWLHFDGATLTFSGTPANGDVGPLTVRVTATDVAGATAVCDFTLSVANTNDAPLPGRPIGAQTATQNAVFRFTVPAAAFTDADAADTLTYSAALASGGPLPSWLNFDATTHSFNGAPQASDAGQVAVRVTATDHSGASAQTLFVIKVVGAPETTPESPARLPTAPPAATEAASPAPSALPTRTLVTAPALVTPGRVVAEATPDLGSGSAETTAIVASVRSETDLGGASRPASRYDAVLTDVGVLQFAGLDSNPLPQQLRTDDLRRSFDEMLRHMTESSDSRRLLAESGVVLSAGLSIGYVVWLVRGGVLISSMVSALPAWQMIDPMPVLAAARKADRKATRETEEPEVERLFDEAPRGHEGQRVAGQARRAVHDATPSPEPRASADRQRERETST